MNPTRYRTLNVDGLRLFYREAGPPDAPAVLPDAEVHVIDAGHFALDEAPDVVADLTRKFLDTTVNGATTPG